MGVLVAQGRAVARLAPHASAQGKEARAKTEIAGMKLKTSGRPHNLDAQARRCPCNVSLHVRQRRWHSGRNAATTTRVGKHPCIQRQR